MKLIENFNPNDSAKYGRIGTGTCWDRATGEAINILEHSVNTGGGFIIPAADSEGDSGVGRIIGGDNPGAAVEVTRGIATGYCFEPDVTQLVPSLDRPDDPPSAVAAIPWGFAKPRTAQIVRMLITPYVVDLGGVMGEVVEGPERELYPFSKRPLHISATFKGVQRTASAGAIATRLAEATGWDHTTGKITSLSDTILAEEALSLSQSRD